MIRISLVLFFFANVSSSAAQLRTYLEDQFSDNHLKWLTEETATYQTNISAGKFVFTKNSDHGRFVTQHQFIDVSLDFTLEADFVFYTAGLTNGIGLVCGHNYPMNKGNWFLISENAFSIQSPEGSRKDVGNWITSTAIRSSGQVNHLKIEQRDSVMYFYINGHEVQRIPKLPLYDTNFGMITFANGKTTVDNWRLQSATRINLADERDHGLAKESLGPSVNSIYAEVHPQIAADGKTLYYGRKSSPENIGGEKDFQDIWFSTTTDGTSWSKAKNLGSAVNTPMSDNLVSISPDNNILTFFYYQAEKKTFGIRARTATGWSGLKPLDIEIENESVFLEACVSPDGKAVLFTAKNPRNLFYHPKRDERDIYVCLKLKNNGWSTPLNLGPSVNTIGNEFSPFVAADGRTLYFATDGLPGYGNVDIFMTQRLDDTWTNWSKPVNLGPGINTREFDAYYTIPASGHSAYMVSSLNSLGHADIVRIKIPEAIQPDPVVLVSGRTLNAKTGQPVSASIYMDDLGSQKHVGEAISNESTGEYSIVLAYGKNYGFHASAKGFISVNENLGLDEIKSYSEVTKDLLLVPLKKGETIPLNNVFFEKGKPTLRNESYPELDRLVGIMHENPTLEIELGGHTDNVGSQPSLIVLSRERVATVKEYLVRNGVPAKRIVGKGYGPDKPLVKNDTEANRMKNRRVEFKIRKI